MAVSALVKQLFMETDIYIKLQSVLEDEQKVVERSDYEGLYAIVSGKEEALAVLAGIVSSRRSLVSAMLKDTGVEEEGGLAALIEIKTGEEKAALRDARKGLLDAMERAGVLNKRNQLLMGAALGNLNRCLDFLRSFFAGGTYLPTGHRGARPLKGTRLRKGV